MTQKPPTASDPRKERLAAQLRANLRRRKAQGRAQADAASADEEGDDDEGAA